MSETFTRRNLPHWYVPGAMHFVTFRLAGSLPRHVIDDLKNRKDRWLKQSPPAGVSKGRHRERIHKQLFAIYDKFLDHHFEDINWLADPRVAALMRSSLYYLDGEKYGLLSYCIMPNHVHTLFLPFGSGILCEKDLETFEPGESREKTSPVSSIMHSLKGYTAHEANKILGRDGQFWQHESYDHWVRDDKELERIVNYINANPVKASLAPSPHDYYWCSAHERYLMDGDTCGWLNT